MSRNCRRTPRPTLTALEGRLVPAVYTVTSLLDDGSPGTLRSRVIAANARPGADTVVFKPGLKGAVHLTGGQIQISDNLTLVGPGATRMAVDGNATSRIFQIDNGTGGADLNVIIRGLELRNGKDIFGGAILSDENLTLDRDVINANQANATAAIDSVFGNLTIKNCTISGNTSTNGVGGVYFYGAASPTTGFTFTVTGSTISGNTALNGKGGGLFLYAGSTTITSSVITGNSATENGGGVYAYSQVSGLTIAKTTIAANRASGLANGGGLESRAAQTTITGCTIADNTAASYGGGVFAIGAVTISGSTVKDNTSLFEGGGIAAFGTAPCAITGSTITGNFSDVDGGGLLRQNGAATIVGCTFADNYSFHGGGMFLNTTGVVTLQNSTLSGNGAESDGGAVYLNGTALVVQNCTIAFNRASLNTSGRTGGGIFAEDGSVSLESTIVAQNSDRGGQPDLSSATGTPFTANHCLVGSAIGIGFNSDATTQQLLGRDPMLAPLSNNGGPTQTHALLAGSPCIDQGSNPANLTTDQRGGRFRRQRGLAVDIGAVERQ
jgi:hypothetical protein